MEINIFQNLYQNVEMLKGIGEKKKKYFTNLGIEQCLDVLFILPSKITQLFISIRLDATNKNQFIQLEKYY